MEGIVIMLSTCDDILPSPVVYVGPHSTRVGVEVAKLAPMLSFSSEILCIDSQDLQRKNKGVFTWSPLNESIVAESDTTMEEIRIFLEKLSKVPLHMGFMFDFCEGFSSSLSARILEDIKDEYNSLSLVCIQMKPLEEIHGIASINGLLSTLVTLECSDSVMIRGYEDARQGLVHGQVDDNSAPGLQDMNKYIACDIASGFATIASDTLWPFHMFPQRKMLIDVRSSLHRALKPTKKVKTDYNPLRALATNIHSLDISHNMRFGDSTSRSIEFCSLASIVRGNKSKGLQCVSHKSPACDVSTILHWAAPSINWPHSSELLYTPNMFDSLFEEDSHLDRIINAGKKSSGSSNSSTSISSNNSLSLSSMGSSRTARVTTSSSKYGVDEESSDQFRDISVMAFDSVYAREEITRLAGMTKELVDRRAFLHSFHSGGISEIDIMDAHYSVTQFLENMS